MATEVILNYEQKMYQSKIDELQGYWNELNAHLETIKSLRSQLSTFWTDDNARETKQILDLTVDRVQSRMNTIRDSIDMYKKIIDEIEGHDIIALGLLKEAISIVKSLL